MDDRRDFDLSLKAGQIAEEEIRELLTNHCLDPSRVTIEVKRDELLHRTGNVFVEYSSRGQMSGLVTSKADWWVIMSAWHNDKIGLLVESTFLKERLRVLRLAGRLLLTNGGDYNTSRGYLVKIEELFRE